MNGSSGNLALLLDTHILVWIANGDKQLSTVAFDAVMNPDNPLYLSAVNAWEYADLEQRGRFSGSGPLEPLLEIMGIQTLGLPASLWTAAAALPDIHRDPIDRMMVAHAAMLEMPLVSADRNVRKYSINTIW